MPRYALGNGEPILPSDSWIAPTADVIGDVRLGREVGVWFQAVIRADNTPIVVGDRTNIQDGVIMHSDPDAPLTVGAGCTIGHRAILHGCTIGDNVLIGMGATLLNNAVIGDNSIVGAGSLVTEGKVFASGSLIVGAPAKVVRQLDEATLDHLRRSAALYASKQRDYSAALQSMD